MTKRQDYLDAMRSPLALPHDTMDIADVSSIARPAAKCSYTA